MTKIEIIKLIEYSIKKYYKKIIEKTKNNSNISIEKIIYKMKKNKKKIFYNYELYKKYRDIIISKNSIYYFFDKVINTSNNKIIYIDVIKKTNNKTKYICAFNNKKILVKNLITHNIFQSFFIQPFCFSHFLLHYL